jgi:hypothetical protein
MTVGQVVARVVQLLQGNEPPVSGV